MIISTVVLYVMFMVFAIFGYLTYGGDTEPNITSNFPNMKWYSIMTRMGLCFVTLTVFPLMIIPMVVGIKNRVMHVVVTTGIILVAMGISLFGFNLSYVNNICGAFSVFPLAGLFPGFIGWKLLGYNFWGMLCLMIVGLVGTILGFIYPEPDVRGLVDNCSWQL
jgi:hypothetical protein